MPEKSSGTIKFPQVENLPYGLLEWNSRWFLELWANLLTSQLFTLGLILTIWWNFSVIQRCIKINKFGKTTLRLFFVLRQRHADFYIFHSNLPGCHANFLNFPQLPFEIADHSQDALNLLYRIPPVREATLPGWHSAPQWVPHYLTSSCVLNKKKTLTLTLTLSRNSFLHRFQNYLSRCCMQFHRFLGLQTSSWRVSWGKRSSHFSYKEVTQSEW